MKLIARSSLPTGWNPIVLGLVFALCSNVWDFPNWANYMLVGLYSIVCFAWFALMATDVQAEKIKLNELVKRLEELERRTGLRRED